MSNRYAGHCSVLKIKQEIETDLINKGGKVRIAYYFINIVSHVNFFHLSLNDMN